MLRTKVGYAGGTTESPTYADIGDHTEALQIEFDPRATTYGALLELFWANHDPTCPKKTQYSSIIFAHSQEQEREARASLAARQAATLSKITTRVRAYERFTNAEGYHQKYMLQRTDRADRRVFVAIGLDPDDDEPSEDGPPGWGNEFAASTVAARVNGYMGGYAPLEALNRELPAFGFAPRVEDRLRVITEKKYAKRLRGGKKKT